jgi:hypothetical protein
VVLASTTLTIGSPQQGCPWQPDKLSSTVEVIDPKGR